MQKKGANRSLVCGGVVSPLSSVMTASEADERWGKPSGTVRVAVSRGRFDEWIERGHVRKSGSTWLVTEQAMTAVYGPEPKNKKEEKK